MMAIDKLHRIVFLIFLGTLLTFQGGYSIGAYPFPQTLTQPDGSTITIRLHGDEWYNWITTTDEFRILKGPSGHFEYAAQLKSGEIVSSGTRASDPQKRAQKERTFLSDVPKNLGISATALLQQRKERLQSQLKSSLMSTFFPTRGEANMLVILVNFSDTQFTYGQNAFERFMNEPNYNGTGSFFDYYQEVSGGLLSVNSTVTQWVNVPWDHDYYGPESKWAELAYEAIKAASSAGIDFSLFDNDEDGIVEGIAIIHQGAGQEVTGDVNDVWSHSYRLASTGIPVTGRTFNGVVVDQYTMQPEWRDGNGAMNSIGIICHEFGHNLGLPDFYDTLNGDYDGTGRWDLMASGAYNGSPIGSSPAHHNPFSKAELDWVSLDVIDSPASIDLDPVMISKQVLRVNSPNQNEYLLLENRRRTGFDSFIPGEGLIVYHADSSWITEHRPSNIINTELHQGFYPVPAGGTLNSSSCPFPGTLNIVELTDYSTPAIVAWDGLPFNRSITNITSSGTTISFDYMSIQDGSPINLHATAIDNRQIQLSWESSSDNYPILLVWSPDGVFGIPEDGRIYQADETITGGGTVLYYGADPGPFIHDNLTASTQYHYSIWSNKGEAYSQSIKTEELTNPDPVDQFPWFDGFEMGFTHWRQETVTGNNLWEFTDNGNQGLAEEAFEGQYFATLSISDWTNPVTRLISPVLNLNEETTYFLDFRHIQPVWENDQDQLKVSIRTNGGPWEELALYDDNTTGWAHRRIKLPYSQPVEVAFEGHSNYGYGIGLDSVVVYPEAECISLPPSNSSSITASEVTETSMKVSWQRGDGDGLLVVARKNTTVHELPTNGMSYTANSAFGVGDDLGGGAFVVYNGTGNQAEITGLEHTSNYHFSFFEYYSGSFCYQYEPEEIVFSTSPRIINIVIKVIDSESLPLENAPVTIDNEEILSDSQGLASFQMEYNPLFRAFKVSKEGYSAVAGRFITDTPQQISVQLPDFDPLSPSFLKTTKDYQTIGLSWNPVINDDFENYQSFTTSLNGWTLEDKDGSLTYGLTHVTFPNESSAMSFMVFDVFDSQVLQLSHDISPLSGSKVLACFAAVNIPNDDWIISPSFEVKESDFFSFAGRSLTSQYGLEVFNVFVKRKEDADWIPLAQNEMAPTEWTRFEYHLAAYAGDSVKVAIQCVSDDAAALLLDNLRVGYELGVISLSPTNKAAVPTDLAKTSSIRTSDKEVYKTKKAINAAPPLYTGNVVYQIFKDQSLLTSLYGFENVDYTDDLVGCGQFQYAVQAYYPQINVSSQPSNIAMVTSCYSVLFTIHNPSDDPVEGAEVTFNNQTMLTNYLGQVSFDAVSLGPSKSFRVEMSGFDAYEGTLDVSGDQSLTVILQIATSEASLLDVPIIRISPNPVKINSLLEGLPPGPCHIQLFDMTGKIVLSRMVEDRPSFPLQLSAFRPGIYMLVVNTKQEVVRIKIVKTD